MNHMLICKSPALSTTSIYRARSGCETVCSTNPVVCSFCLACQQSSLFLCKRSRFPSTPHILCCSADDVRLSSMQMAASFALGAAGVVLGTRLNATYESVYPEAKKQALVKAGSSASSHPSTIRTTLYDELSGVAWPPAVDGNCLRNELTAQYSSQTPLQVTQWHTLIWTPIDAVH